MSAEHVVFFPAPDGSPAFRRLPSLDEVVAFVEHLRNERDVREGSVHTLTEVPLAFKTVYRVEVAGAAAPEAPAEPVADAVSEPAPEPVVEAAPELAPEPVAEVPAPDVEAVAEPVAEVPAQPESPEAEPVAAADTHSLGFFAS